MTGRRAGPCTDFSARAVNSFGRPAMRCGRGCGYRRAFYTPRLPGWLRCNNDIPFLAGDAVLDQKAYLNKRAAILEKQLTQVKDHLATLGKDD
ncbi:DUF5320 domain-containing protein [Oscillospiraceae bacterium LTW-04]